MARRWCSFGRCRIDGSVEAKVGDMAAWSGRTGIVRARTLLLAGAACFSTAHCRAVWPAEVRPGGALDLTLTGFARFLVHGGQLDDARQDDSFARGLDFSNDTEFHVLARGRDAATGLVYGATIEFDADTDQTLNTTETWVFARGGWGEVRLGDVEGVADESVVGAQEVAAGTGGIDGDVIDEIAVPVVQLTDTGTATKLRYYTPSLGGFSLGLSYTPTLQEIDGGDLNGQFIARKGGDMPMQAEHVVEGGLVWEGELGEAEILASAVGIVGRLTNDAVAELGGDRWWGWQAGATVDLFGVELGGSFADERLGDQGRTFFTAGVGVGEDAWNVSLTYGQVVASAGGSPYGRPFNLVFSADYLLAPGLELAGDLGLFDNDGTDPDYPGGDRGWQAVGRLGVAF
jgi:outer membrane protein OmpU